MSEKIEFEGKTKDDLFEIIKKNKKRKILNFLNANDLYHFNKKEVFKKSLSGKDQLNFIDGALISLYFSTLKLKKIPRNRGPTFTREFLKNSKLSGGKKHFFIGLVEEDLKELKEKNPHLKKCCCHNPPYINDVCFPKNEIDEIVKKINKEKPDFVWIGIGSPKQNILSFELFKKTKAKYFINVGAALDFLLDKKKEAPLIIRKMGLEWFYRLVKDYNHSKKKVLRNFIALRYLNSVKLK